MKIKGKSSVKKEKAAKRLAQVEAWLQGNFAAPLPVKVYLVDKVGAQEHGTLGMCVLDTKKHNMKVYIKVDGNLAWMIETLIHEWAHVLCLPFTTYHRSEHCDEYFLALGRIYRKFYEEGGESESKRITAVAP